MGLLLIAKVIFYLVAVTWALFFFKRRVGLIESLLITLLLASVPWWGLYPRWFKHQELCNLDGGYRVYNTVPEGVNGYYHSSFETEKGFIWRLNNYKYAFIEGYGIKFRSKFFRYSLNENGELNVEEIEQPVSRYEWFYEYLGEDLPFNFTGTKTGIRNMKTGVVMASLTNYVIKRPWGWYFSFPDKGKGCIGQKLSGTENFSTDIIASKALLKERADGAN